MITREKAASNLEPLGTLIKKNIEKTGGTMGAAYWRGLGEGLDKVLELLNSGKTIPPDGFFVEAVYLTRDSGTVPMVSYAPEPTSESESPASVPDEPPTETVAPPADAPADDVADPTVGVPLTDPEPNTP